MADDHHFDDQHYSNQDPRTQHYSNRGLDVTNQHNDDEPELEDEEELDVNQISNKELEEKIRMMREQIRRKQEGMDSPDNDGGDDS
jgi:hypothetical protein